MPPPKIPDQDLFLGLHRVIAEQTPAPSTERRLSERRPYSATEFVAPATGVSLPPWNTFREVRCHDISMGGFSFWDVERPTFENLVVALGTSPDFIFVAAKVLHCRKMAVDEGSLFLIGCQFTGRVASSE